MQSLYKKMNNNLNNGIDVSIIIVNYNTRQMTSECIDSVIAKTSGIEYEIILVDNASNDGSKEFFSNDERVLYVYNDDNLGFGRANNKGIEIARGRNILFLNSDTLLRNNAVKILSDYLDNKPRVGVCGGNLFDQFGAPNHSYFRRLPSIPEYFMGLRYYQFGFGRNWQFNYMNRPINVGHITGADLMVRKNIIDTVGSFNPRFFLYYEETELCYRIMKAGYKIMSNPEAEIMHYRKGKISYTTIYHIKRSFFIYLSLTCNAFERHICELMFWLKCNSSVQTTRDRWQNFVVRSLSMDVLRQKMKKVVLLGCLIQ